MDQYEFMQFYKSINEHDDIVLRTPTKSTGERMLNVYFKNQTYNRGSILEFEYPDCEKKIQDIKRDLCWNAKRNILAIQIARSLNSLFGLQCYSSNIDIHQEEIMQLWYTRTVNNCNLVEMPQSLSNLLVMGENRV